MGNSYNKSNQYRDHKQSVFSNQDGQALTSQFSLPHFVGNLSGRSFVSISSNQSVYSASRPWSRVARRSFRRDNSIPKHDLEGSKTPWPVSHRESLFLPEFPITTNLLQKDFQILNTIAKGAFGEVIKVRKNIDGKEYALKILNKSQVVSERAVNQVKEEARIQSVCGHHSFIAGAVLRWQTKKTLYIVSEYIPGGELLDLLNKYNKLPEELVRIFVAEIAIAIDFLHNAGVIYRDLKPENILLDTDCHIRLVDFGLSKWLSIGARTTTLCGTLKYMAPEILNREPYGHAVDWWSLGVIACRMLTDEYPAFEVNEDEDLVDRFSTSVTTNDSPITISEVKEMARYANKQPAGTLPKSAGNLTSASRALLMRLLERDPKVRMRSLRQLQQSAFYMGYNFEHVKAKKLSPKSILERHFPSLDETAHGAASNNLSNDFPTFDQPSYMA